MTEKTKVTENKIPHRKNLFPVGLFVKENKIKRWSSVRRRMGMASIRRRC